MKAIKIPLALTGSLTTGIDNSVGTSGNDVINAGLVAGADSFTSLDKIDGGALTTAAGATVTGIEIANVTSAGAITALNVSGFTGLQTLDVASGAAISAVVAAGATVFSALNYQNILRRFRGS